VALKVETTGSHWHAATPHRRTGARRGARGARRGRWAEVAVVALTAALLSLPGRHALAEGLDADVVASATYWGHAYDIDPAYIERVIMCESNGDRYAVNLSGAIGIVQIMPSTGIALENKLNADPYMAPGLTTFDPDFRDVTYYDTEIHLFAWATYRGLGGLWACA